jgi:N6-L-threonylcarbamoyladenine synthase
LLCLGIESTAHTFGCCVLEADPGKNAGKIISDTRDVYKPQSGSGIHPREASRHHGDVSSAVLKKAIQQANIHVKDLDVVAYSAGPGLGPCLRVGAVVARALCSYYNKPIIPVNHALGHVELGMMLTSATDPLVLLVSGGHTMILAFSQGRWRIFGETLDITVGQLFDQFGRSIGLASPCGSEIEKMANKGSGVLINLPYVVKGNDVSFSGLLTSAVRFASSNTTRDRFSDVCYSLQETAFAMLVESVERALSFTGKKEVLIVGGVAANYRLSEMLSVACKRHGSNFFACPINYAGDNGAQIAWPGLREYVAVGKNVDISQSFVRQAWRIDTVDVRWRE